MVAIAMPTDSSSAFKYFPFRKAIEDSLERFAISQIRRDFNLRNTASHLALGKVSTLRKN